MKKHSFSLFFTLLQTTTIPIPPEIPAIHSASEWEMYKKLINMNPSTTTTILVASGLNKAENPTLSSSTSSPITATPASIHHASNSNNSSDLDINDENAPSNFHQTTAIENNGSDKVIYESPYERPLMPSIQHHHHHHTPSPTHLSQPLTKMECDEEDYATASALEHLHHHNTPYAVHKSIHHMSSATHYRELTIDDENLENKQQNFAVNPNVDEEEPWRPW